MTAVLSACDDDIGPSESLAEEEKDVGYLGGLLQTITRLPHTDVQH